MDPGLLPEALQLSPWGTVLCRAPEPSPKPPTSLDPSFVAAVNLSPILVSVT